MSRISVPSPVVAYRRVIRMLPVAFVGLVSCYDGVLPPFGAWRAECSTAPFSLTMSFPRGEDPDDRGEEQVRVANLQIPLDATGLSDFYAMQVRLGRPAQTETWTGEAETMFMERAPMPSALVNAWGLLPLTVDLDAFELGGQSEAAEAGCFAEDGPFSAEYCRYWRLLGTCSWGGVEGEFVARQVETTGCSSSGGRPGAAGAAVAAALLVLASRRRARRPAPSGAPLVLLLVGAAGCKDPSGTWLGSFGSEGRLELGIPKGSADFSPSGRLWVASRPGDVLAFSCEGEHGSAAKVKTDSCTGAWLLDGGAGEFAVDAAVQRGQNLDSVIGSFGWLSSGFESGDLELDLLRVGPPPAANAVAVVDTGFSDSGGSDSGCGDTAGEPVGATVTGTYAYGNASGEGFLDPGESLLIYSDEDGNLADCMLDESGLLVAHNHDAMSGEDAGTYSDAVACGCAHAIEYGQQVTCCFE